MSIIDIVPMKNDILYGPYMAYNMSHIIWTIEHTILYDYNPS